jgi:hypothetical protein
MRLLPLALTCAAVHAAVDPSWQRQPIVSQAILDAGFGGGEGCQVVRAVAWSPDASTVLFGTDVGGLYRSLNGGPFHPALVGWVSRGGGSFAFDPRNSSHVIGVGTNSNYYSDVNGPHVSFDGAASWTHTLKLGGVLDYVDGNAIAFDPSSYDASLGYTTRVYYSDNSNGLYRSEDGGLSWANVSAKMSQCVLAASSNGTLFLSSNYYLNFGLYASYDRGATFRTLRDEYTLGLTIPVSTNGGADDIYISNWAGIAKSTDLGNSWEYVAGTGLPHGNPFHKITVSPANNSYMTVFVEPGAYFTATRYTSVDGGATWQSPPVDSSLAFMPFNGRPISTAYHPSNASVQLSTGGDWITRSDDGGLHLRWAADGYNGVMAGYTFNFNTLQPDVLMLSFQDYSGAVSIDGGKTFTYANLENLTFGGDGFGGFALNKQVMWAGGSPGWGGPRWHLVSYDGGAVWVNTSLVWSSHSLEVSYADPVNAQVGFAANLRTADGGASFQPMQDCSFVATHDADPSVAPGSVRTLLGVNASGSTSTVVMSNDSGATWQALFAGPAYPVRDLAWDYASKAMYVVANSALYKCGGSLSPSSSFSCSELSSLPLDQFNSSSITSVAVDPVNPAIVYASNTKNVYLAWNAVVRSTDSGVTWDSIVLDTPLSNEADAPLQGPHEVSWLRVHPVTRYVWAAGECFGMWSAPPPAGM